MRRVHTLVRRSAIAILVVALATFVVGAAFAQCTLLQQSKMDCCPKNKPDHCPLSSKASKLCDYAQAESKIGPAKDKVDFGPAPVLDLSAAPVLVVVAQAAPIAETPPDQSGLYLLHRVLLI
jgi:hypothetical protein